jgi:predicted esterase
MTGGAAVHTIATRIHGRYLVQAPAAGPPVGFLVGFHGYAENAAIHLQELAQIPGAERWVLAAVQGLARFYNRQQEVVAGWMTREDRELAIADNVAYAAAVLEELQRSFPAVEHRVFAGFSQGVAMTYRAALGSSPRCDGLIALAGDVPPELAERPWLRFPVLIGRGYQEEWYSEEKLAADVALLAAKGIPVEVCRFAGGHHWTDEFRRAAGALLDAVAGPGDRW